MSLNVKKNLVKVIKENPGCIITVDNDCWWINKARPEHEMTEEEFDEWRDDIIAESGEVESLGDGGYGSGSRYGGDVLQALAVIVGVKIESV